MVDGGRRGEGNGGQRAGDEATREGNGGRRVGPAVGWEPTKRRDDSATSQN
jgi:hypothetical protein